MQRWQHDYPNRFALGQAVLLIALAAALNAGDLPRDALIQRLAFVGGFFLLGFDTLLISSYTRGERSLRNPLRWVNAGHMAWYFGTYILLATAGGIDAAALIGPLAGALIFGAAMAFLPFADVKGPLPPLPPGRYDTTRPLSDHPFRHKLYLLWPLIVLMLIAGMAAFPPEGGWDEDYLLFQIAFLPWIMQLYPHAGGAPWYRGMWVIKTLGLACLVTGLFWT
jgi:hypothetical protein